MAYGVDGGWWIWILVLFFFLFFPLFLLFPFLGAAEKTGQ